MVDNEESEAAEARPGWHRNKGVNEILQLIFIKFTEDFLFKMATNIILLKNPLKNDLSKLGLLTLVCKNFHCQAV